MAVDFLIDAQNLEKTYEDGTQALRGASLRIKKGEFLAIMGPSGSGKSTLLHIIGLLDFHTKGKYKFDGKSVESYSENELARLRNEKMGFVFQAFNLLPKTTVLDNVKLPLYYSNKKPREMHEMALKAIESVGLSHRVNHLSSQLSGGEKQRVAIARALVNEPDIIFADEPTGNLDSKSGQIVMEIIEKLHDEGQRTIVLITHESRTAQHAERIIKVMDGKIESDKKVNGRLHAIDNFTK